MSEKDELHNKTLETIEHVQKFAEIFYRKLDEDRHSVGNLYLDTATLTWNGNNLEGGENIKSFLLQKLPKTDHNLLCLDGQNLPAQAVGEQTTILITASGTVRYDKKSSVPFQQNFLITEKDMKWRIAVDNFRSQ
eukprot:TRINITY_DN10801_c0_g1_i1.p1 TRINITY_DN10801_c0_g1~~TRINITY_DN10801_c0_g1_i1.p1  ORF type:complete len:135 (-),score=24.29 TRINITY_DN10801_c0_g1_i1:205-609(-)